MGEHRWLTAEQMAAIEKKGAGIITGRWLMADRREMRKLCERILTAQDVGEAEDVWDEINDMLDATK